MEGDKKFYWIKLRTDFFNRDEIDFLMSQDNGSQYVVLYLMLCLNTANENGVFSVSSVEKIRQSYKKLIVGINGAIRLFRQIGLIEKESDGMYRITNFNHLVGRETSRRIKNSNPL